MNADGPCSEPHFEKRFLRMRVLLSALVPPVAVRLQVRLLFVEVGRHGQLHVPLKQNLLVQLLQLMLKLRKLLVFQDGGATIATSQCPHNVALVDVALLVAQAHLVLERRNL
jgi:hypothetical protein